MPVNTRELLLAAELVAQHEEMKVNFKYSLGCAALTGATTFGGGIIGGPSGLVIGALAGSAAAMMYTRGKFKSVISVIRNDLTRDQKRLLCRYIVNSLKDVNATDLIALSACVLNQERLLSAVVDGIRRFFEGELRMPVSTK